jgi:rhamnopyranosyl-N-acetylglucosaminyl-diphospho-decaprenol beta-1,3/1,4-galactofuranosyltransferase
VSERVMAVVLTCDARSALEECLGAIRAQTRAVDEILVVDNASTDSIDDVVTATPNATLLRLPENRGPAGGYAEGLTAFLASGAALAWVIDDDCVPARDALAAQLAVAPRAPVVLARMIDHDSHEIANTQGWCGVLLARDVVETVGVPNAALFWWTEDTEYLQWRIPRAGFRVERCADAAVRVRRSRLDGAKPAWKYYYEARNQVYYRLVTQRPATRPVPRWLTRRVRYGRAARSVGKLAVRALLREHTTRGRKFVMVCRGTVDGVRGRLGPTVPVDGSDRPAPQQPEGVGRVP